MDASGADLVVAGVDERHGDRQGGELRDVVLPDHQLLQRRQCRERAVVHGRDVVGRDVDPLQLA